MAVTEQIERTKADTIFFSVLLWVCAAAAVWLLVSPVAWTRRALTRRVEGMAAEVQREQAFNRRLNRWREGLESDTSMIEREARKLGYGRPGEYVFALSPADLRAARSRWNAGGPEEGFPWSSALGESLLPALALLLAGVLAVLFFTDLKVEDPAAAVAPVDPPTQS